MGGPAAGACSLAGQGVGGRTPHFGIRELLNKLSLSFGLHPVVAGSPVPVYLKSIRGP